MAGPNPSQNGWEALRFLVHEPPTRQNWRAILSVLGGWSHGNQELAVDYAREHLAAWPVLSRATDSTDPLPWTLATHLDLGHSGLEQTLPIDSDFHKRLAVSPHIQALTISGRAALNALLDLPALPHVTVLDLSEMTPVRDAQILTQNDLRRLQRSLPNLSTLAITNCPTVGGLDLSDIDSLRHLRLAGVSESGLPLPLANTHRLLSLELSGFAGSRRLIDLIEDTRLGAMEHLTLRSNIILEETLWLLDEMPRLRTLDLSFSRLTPQAVRCLTRLDRPLDTLALAACGGQGIQRLDALPFVTRSNPLLPALVSHCGHYEHNFDSPGDGESESFELVRDSEGHLNFSLDWSGYWVGPESADSDSYDLNGLIYPISSDCLLLVPDKEGGDLDLMNGCWPEVILSQGACTLQHPADTPHQYEGPFNIHLNKV